MYPNINFVKCGKLYSFRIVMARAFYAVHKGKVPGVYKTWDECKEQVHGFPNASFKKFPTECEAWDFVRGSLTSSSETRKRKFDNLNEESSTSSVLSSTPATVSFTYQNTTRSSVVTYAPPCKPGYYAVYRGSKPGVYYTWTECKAQVKNFKNPMFRKFETEEAAAEFVATGDIKKLSKKQARNLEINEKFIEAGEEEYTIDELKTGPEEVVTVFTDGASSKNGQIGAAAGIGVYWGPNHPLNTSMRLPGRQTNNRAEIYAAIHALRQVKQIGAKNVKLYTDSQFLIRGITGWIDKWKKNDWKLSNGEPVKNKDDFMELDKVREGLNVDFIYIRAHANNPGNVEADRLAVAGARKDCDDTIVFLS